MKLQIPFLCLLGSALVSTAPAQSNRVEFTRMVAHWSEYKEPAYLDFIKEAEPELVQLGFYGAHFWSLAHTPQYKGYPAHFPVQGLKECGDWFAEKNAILRGRGIRVIGHFNVEFLVGDPESPQGPRGFFKFYRELWDEAELGPKPVADPIDFLEQGADGKPILSQSYKIGGMNEYWACLRNPHWQTVMKAWVKRGIERGLDGFIANYFYRHNCLCAHCQSGFRAYLGRWFTATELKTRLGIGDLKAHRFDELIAWHKPDESTPLRREMLRWSQISNKEVFDKVFVRHGRSLKPDLIVAQWDHLSNFSAISGDERCLLPTEMWGRDEDYLWYSMGASGYYTDLKQGFLGEGTLQARYLRGAFNDKPFTLGKYESVRTRVAIAELAANGGAPMGFYTRFTNPDCREVIVRYYQFLKRNDALYRANRSHAEALLVFPRRAVHAGDLAPLEAFRQTGRKLLDTHVLFDVLPDELVTDEVRRRYGAIIAPSSDVKLPDVKAGKFSRFDAPPTVRVSASRPANGRELTLHLVNYNREELPPDAKGRPNPGRNTADEKPIAVERVRVDLVLPAGSRVTAISALSPEAAEAQKLEFQQADGRVRFVVPKFLAYAVVRVELGAGK